MRNTEPPDVFLVGAPKCGTTAMHAYLAAHPEVFLPAQKELHYYGSDLGGLPSQLTPEQHEALFEGSEGAAVVGETCIWALYSTRAAREIAAAHPKARIVAMIREPVEMMAALHSEFLYHAIEDEPRFERAVDLAADRRAGRHLPCGDRFPAAIYDYAAVASFAGQLDRYVAAFGRDRVHVILYDDLRRDVAGVYRKLLEFLGVDPDFAPEFRVVNRNKRVRSARLQHLLYNPDSTGLATLRRLVPLPALHDRLTAAAARWNVTQSPRRPIPRRLRARLEAEFTLEVDRLSHLLGRDLAALWRRG